MPSLNLLQLLEVGDVELTNSTASNSTSPRVDFDFSEIGSWNVETWFSFIAAAGIGVGAFLNFVNNLKQMFRSNPGLSKAAVEKYALVAAAYEIVFSQDPTATLFQNNYSREDFDDNVDATSKEKTATKASLYGMTRELALIVRHVKVRLKQVEGKSIEAAKLDSKKQKMFDPKYVLTDFYHNFAVGDKDDRKEIMRYFEQFIVAAEMNNAGIVRFDHLLHAGPLLFPPALGVKAMGPDANQRMHNIWIEKLAGLTDEGARDGLEAEEFKRENKEKLKRFAGVVRALGEMSEYGRKIEGGCILMCAKPDKGIQKEVEQNKKVVLIKKGRDQFKLGFASANGKYQEKLLTAIQFPYFVGLLRKLDFDGKLYRDSSFCDQLTGVIASFGGCIRKSNFVVGYSVPAFHLIETAWLVATNSLNLSENSIVRVKVKGLINLASVLQVAFPNRLTFFRWIRLLFSIYADKFSHKIKLISKLNSKVSFQLWDQQVRQPYARDLFDRVVASITADEGKLSKSERQLVEKLIAYPLYAEMAGQKWLARNSKDSNVRLANVSLLELLNSVVLENPHFVDWATDYVYNEPNQAVTLNAFTVDDDLRVRVEALPDDLWQDLESPSPRIIRGYELYSVGMATSNLFIHCYAHLIREKRLTALWEGISSVYELEKAAGQRLLQTPSGLIDRTLLRLPGNQMSSDLWKTTKKLLTLAVRPFLKKSPGPQIIASIGVAGWVILPILSEYDYFTGTVAGILVALSTLIGNIGMEAHFSRLSALQAGNEAVNEVLKALLLEVTSFVPVLTNAIKAAGFEETVPLILSRPEGALAFASVAARYYTVREAMGQMLKTGWTDEQLRNPAASPAASEVSSPAASGVSSPVVSVAPVPGQNQANQLQARYELLRAEAIQLHKELARQLGFITTDNTYRLATDIVLEKLGRLKSPQFNHELLPQVLAARQFDLTLGPGRAPRKKRTVSQILSELKVSFRSPHQSSTPIAGGNEVAVPSVVAGLSPILDSVVSMPIVVNTAYDDCLNRFVSSLNGAFDEFILETSKKDRFQFFSRILRMIMRNLANSNSRKNSLTFFEDVITVIRKDLPEIVKDLDSSAADAANSAELVFGNIAQLLGAQGQQLRAPVSSIALFTSQLVAGGAVGTGASGILSPFRP